MSDTDAAAKKVTWDYTEHAAHYDNRADYSDTSISEVLKATQCSPGTVVADIGAGTGKLTKLLLAHGLVVRAVEPNDAMRGFGIKNTVGNPVSWTVGTGEETGLPDHSAHCAFFGSSFNVVNQRAALVEVSRIVQPKGYFVCMWNHRDLSDPLQDSIERAIKQNISGYGYGLRREDPTDVIAQSGLFQPSKATQGAFAVEMSADAVIDAWKSHATVKRQSETPERFAEIIRNIEDLVNARGRTVVVPYVTRIWSARLK